MVLGSVERPNSIPKKRFDPALLFDSVSYRPSASSQQEPNLFPVQQVHLSFSLKSFMV